MAVLSTIRIDLPTFEPIQKELDIYIALHPTIKYCINSEISDVEHKQHYQGWIEHPCTQKAYSNYFHGKFKSILKPHQRSFSKVKKPETYYSYILNNLMKPDTSFTTVHTNYTEEEFNQFKQLTPFQPIPKSRRVLNKSHQEEIQADIEARCIKDGKLLTHLVPDVYMDHAPLTIDKYILQKNCTGYCLRIENKLNHTTTRDSLKKGLMELDKGTNLFTPPEQPLTITFKNL